MSGDLASVRSCWVEGRLRDRARDDYMVVKVHPTIIGQQFGLGGTDVETVILSSRLRGSTLFPVTEWPCDVYISRVLDPRIFGGSEFAADQVQLIGWGRIFQSRQDALAEADRYEPQHS